MSNKAKQTKQKNDDYVPCEIIESDEDSQTIQKKLEPEPELNAHINNKKVRQKQHVLSAYYLEDPEIYEIGVDEVGRGPLFGRV